MDVVVLSLHRSPANEPQSNGAENIGGFIEDTNSKDETNILK